MNAKAIGIGIAGVLVGVLALGGILWVSAPSLMMTEDESPYGYEETLEVFEDRIDAGGWSVLNSHDMQEIVGDHGHDVAGVTVYDLCSAEYSGKILERDDARIVTPMMPCRVSVYETTDGSTYIARMNSGLVAQLFGGFISDVMQDATAETEEIIDEIVS